MATTDEEFIHTCEANSHIFSFLVTGDESFVLAYSAQTECEDMGWKTKMSLGPKNFAWLS
jgi:hypothetical protein